MRRILPLKYEIVMKVLPLLTLCAVALLWGCGSDSEPQPNPPVADTLSSTPPPVVEVAPVSILDYQLDITEEIFFVGDSYQLAPQEVTFYNESSGQQQSYWDFGDGTTLTSSETIVSHTYDTAGAYTVQLRVDNTGGKDSAVVNFELHDYRQVVSGRYRYTADTLGSDRGEATGDLVLSPNGRGFLVELEQGGRTVVLVISEWHFVGSSKSIELRIDEKPAQGSDPLIRGLAHLPSIITNQDMDGTLLLSQATISFGIEVDYPGTERDATILIEANRK